MNYLLILTFTLVVLQSIYAIPCDPSIDNTVTATVTVSCDCTCPDQLNTLSKEELIRRLIACQEAKEALEDEVDEINADKVECLTEKAALVEDNLALNVALAKMESDLHDAQDQLDKAHCEIDRLNCMIRDLQQQLAEEQAKLQQCQQQLSDCQKEGERLNAEIVDLQNQIKQLFK